MLCYAMRKARTRIPFSAQGGEQRRWAGRSGSAEDPTSRAVLGDPWQTCSAAKDCARTDEERQKEKVEEMQSTLLRFGSTQCAT